MNLSLLEESGKNAWLMGNVQLEAVLKELEAELSSVKEQVDSVNKARKSAQEGSRGEMLALEEAWRRGISQVLEVQVATAGLRRELLERTHHAAP